MRQWPKSATINWPLELTAMRAGEKRVPGAEPTGAGGSPIGEAGAKVWRSNARTWWRRTSPT